MIKERAEAFHVRIDKLSLESEPSFGQMNVNQMICHCTDTIRMALGEKEADEYGQV